MKLNSKNIPKGNEFREVKMISNGIKNRISKRLQGLRGLKTDLFY